MFQITISDQFVSIIAPDPMSALKLQMWAEDNLDYEGMVLTIFVDQPGFPREFWNRIIW